MNATTSANLFTGKLASYLNRKEYLRIEIDNKDSDYLAVNIPNTGAQRGNDFYVVRDGKIVLTSETKTGDLVLVQVTKYAYGANETQGASLISNLKRFFQHTEAVYVSADKDADGNVRLHTVYRKQGSDFHFNVNFPLVGSLLYDHCPMTAEDTAMFVGMIESFLKRAELGGKVRDQRKAYWNADDPKSITAYGLFQAQREAERA
jgi:hypothetical protein